MSSPVKSSPSGPGAGFLSSLGHDLVGGAISALVTLCFSLSFAAMIFTGDLAGSLAYGISMALTSASITVVIVALTSPFRFAIAGPDSRSAAVQSALAATLATTIQGEGLPVEYVLLALSISTLFTGALLYASGRLNIGRWIRYVPYPVIGGFLASTGWTLVIGGIRVITSKSVTWATLPQFFHADTLWHLAVGVAFTVLMLTVLGRIKHFLALPLLLVLGTAAVHIIRAAQGVSVAQAQRSGWLLEVVGHGRAWLPLRDLSWEMMKSAPFALKGDELWRYLGGMLVLVAVTGIAVLVTGASIEVATRSDADLDQELKGHGIANLISGLFGGLVGQNAIARSMINLQAGAVTRISGVFAGTLCAAVELTRPEVAGYLARPIMGAILAYLGLRLLFDWVIKARANLERTDYLLVIGMLLAIIRFGFVTGLLIGVVVSCLIFAVNYSRISVIKYSFTLDEYGSKVQRSGNEHRYLREHGRQHWVLRLRGYLFFGSVVRLVADARQRIESSKASNQPLRTLVLDFAAVIGIDSSSALTLVKLRQAAEASNLQLVFTALQPEMEKMLRRERCLRDDQVCVALPDLDRALEFCEQKTLLERTEAERSAELMAVQLTAALGNTEMASAFLSFAERVQLQAGEHLVRQGDPSDEVYVVESGRVSILLERPNAPPLRLRSVTSNTCLGEVGLYRNSPRSASIIADIPTTVYRLSRSALTRMEREAPQVAMAFHIFIIRTLADRLVSSDKAIAALER